MLVTVGIPLKVVRSFERRQEEETPVKESKKGVCVPGWMGEAKPVRVHLATLPDNVVEACGLPPFYVIVESIEVSICRLQSIPEGLGAACVEVKANARFVGNLIHRDFADDWMLNMVFAD